MYEKVIRNTYDFFVLVDILSKKMKRRNIMGFIVDHISNRFTNTIGQNKKTVKEEGVQRKSGQFDEILISSGEQSVEEKVMIGDLSKKIVSSVRRETDADKIHRLKQQIADGTYSIDASVIADKILFVEGE